MSRIRGKDTKIEVAVRSILHSMGLRFKKNVRDLPGKPDIVFSKQKIAIFLDGNFWHGHNLPILKKRLNSFWYHKILNNKNRDRIHNNDLRRSGWIVVRFWEESTWKNIDQVSERIFYLVKQNS